MAMSHVLGGAGFKPGYIDATTHVTILPQDGTFRITKSHLVYEAAVTCIESARGQHVTLDAKLVQ
jgi:organic hydroperoxide reductase OsmC/OhrA